MSPNHSALLAGVLAAVTVVVLLLAAIGAGVVVRAVLRFADAARDELDQHRARAAAADEPELTALADAVHTPPQPGDNDWLYELHPDATRWEDIP